jgi:hypothetical protein
MIITVYARMTSEFVRAGKPLFAGGERATKWFFASVRADVASLEKD